MGVKCLAQEHNVVPRPGLEPGPFDLESSCAAKPYVKCMKEGLNGGGGVAFDG